MSKNPYIDLFKRIDNTTLIVTATNRLAQKLLYQWLVFGKTNNTKLVGDERALSLQHWLERLWHDALLHNAKLPHVISDAEALFILSKIPQQEPRLFIPSDKHAKETLSAWQLLCQWQLTLANLSPYLDNQNTSHFVCSAKQFETVCQQNNWIDQSQRLTLLSGITALADILKKQQIQQLYFIGFDTMTPDLEYFINRVHSLGVKIASWKLSQKNTTTVSFHQHQDAQNELSAVAKSVKQLSVKYPLKTIGVIVPDLQNKFLNLQAVFDNHLLAETQNNPLIDNSQRPYIISGGTPLLEIPIVFQLLQWLMLVNIDDFQGLVDILNSPYIKGAREFYHSRQQLSLQVKNKCYRTITIKQLMQTPGFQENIDPVLQKIIAENQHVSNKKYTATTFISLLKKRISLLAWPGECRLKSVEYQALEKLYQVINQLALFERLNYQMTETSWLIALKKLAQSHIFQSKSNLKANIHILGLLESADIGFDYLLIMGMDNRLWPNIARPHPYLPYQLQQQYNMPHASAKKELDFAKKMTAHLLNQAPNVCLSFARINDDNQLQMPSPLLSDYTPEHMPSITSEITAPIRHISTNNQLPNVSTNEKSTLAGGVSIFKNMAECPYRSALIHRLKISPDPRYKKPLDSREKGMVIHRILEYIWRDLKTLKHLQALSYKTQEKMIADHVDRGLQANRNYFAFIPRFLQVIEQKRLNDLIKQWLDFEATRIKPFSIKALEKTLRIDVLGVKLSLRIDRIDRFDNGQSVVIDYKTGRKFNQKNWLNTPIIEPQLPLYAVFENTEAIAVGLVNGYDIGYESLSNIPNWAQEDMPKRYPPKSNNPHQQLPDNFTELKTYWRVALTAEMQRFLAGNISLTPSIQSCQYCEFGAICRTRFPS